MDLKRLLTKISSKWRILLVIFIPVTMLYFLGIASSPNSYTTKNGIADLSGIDFNNNKLVQLNGQWEFYWNKLVMPEDFNSGQKLKKDSFMKVPGVWSDNTGTHYTCQGFATYRMQLHYTSALKDPALRIQAVANAYKLYVNGKLMSKVGMQLTDKINFKNDDKIVIIDLPKNTQKVDMVFQVGNLNCATGGLRVAPIFGSRQVLEQQRMIMLILQMLFMGGILIFGFYYLFLFLLQTKNITALYFSIFCFTTALRSLIWGEMPIRTLYPNVTLDFIMYMNYFTGYNYLAIFILFIYSIYSFEFNKKITCLILFPSLVFDVLLLLTNPEHMTFYTNYLYILLLLQMIYLIYVLIKAVLRKRNDAVLMFIAVFVFIFTIIEDIINYTKLGRMNLSIIFMFGNYAIIMTLSFIQARQNAMDHKKLVLYNEKLLEADKLKDQIMATEMSFLQAQIKPHFLYNALSAIANVCEKDGNQASKLVIDLAIYLRGSLEFNNFDKMSTVEKELEFVDTYFHIEQARFGQKIQLCKDIKVPLDDQIPVLILQPLVENAVRHGISKKPEGGTVTVHMIRRDRNICIEVEDDGIGISNDKTATILNKQDNTKGVGLVNIHSRLLKLYGKGLEVRSELGHTCVRFSIPAVDYNEN